MFNADARQDQFAANMLQFKKNGFYVDIGSCHSKNSNNTYYFQELDWSGITVEINDEYNSSYSNRKNNTHINNDATNLDYSELFKKLNFPLSIDFLSLDVDTLSLIVLKKLPLSEYRFKVITIEHDSYLYGDKYKAEQRKILSENGYLLICSNVYVEPIGNQPNRSFEDWWVDPKEFDKELLNKITSDSIYPTDVMNKFK